MLKPQLEHGKELMWERFNKKGQSRVHNENWSYSRNIMNVKEQSLRALNSQDEGKNKNCDTK